MTRGHATLGSAVRWAYVMDGGRQVFASLITFVLAALLGPEAFGIIAMALVYMAVIELLLKQGMAAAVVQREDLREDHRDSAFWLVMGAALLLSGVSVALSGWWAAANRTPELQGVILGLTVMVPLQGLTVVQEALLRREFRFRSLALRTNVSVLAGGAVGLALAVAGFGVWALVAQQVATALVAVVVLWAVSGWRPGLNVSRVAARDLLGFSTGSFIGSLGAFVTNRADALLIGLFFGPVVVGLYRLADRLMESLGGITVAALMTVSLPELSRAQHDPARFKRGLLRLTWLGAVMTIPVFGLLAGFAEGVLGLLGEEWLPATWALRLVCVAGAVRVAFTFTGPLLQALGKPFEQALLAWSTALCTAGAFVVAGILARDWPVDATLTALASSQALVYTLVIAALCLAIMRRRAGVTLPEMARVVLPAVGTGLLAALLGGLVWDRSPLGDLPDVVALLLAAAAVGSACLGLLVALDPSLRRYGGTAVRALLHAREKRYAKRRPSVDDRPRQGSDGGAVEAVTRGVHDDPGRSGDGRS